MIGLKVVQISWSKLRYPIRHYLRLFNVVYYVAVQSHYVEARPIMCCCWITTSMVILPFIFLFRHKPKKWFISRSMRLHTQSRDNELIRKTWSTNNINIKDGFHLPCLDIFVLTPSNLSGFCSCYCQLEWKAGKWHSFFILWVC